MGSDGRWPSSWLRAKPMSCRRAIELGSLVTAVGSDTGLLARGSEALAARFKS